MKLVELIKKVVAKIVEIAPALWEKLPKEVRVAGYYTASWALLELGEALGQWETIDWGAFFKLFLANIAWVFIGKLKERSASVRRLISK